MNVTLVTHLINNIILFFYIFLFVTALSMN